MARDFFNNITMRPIADDETRFPEALKDCLFFSNAFPLQLDSAVAPIEQSAREDPSVGGLWRDIEPVNGEFRFDLAAQLPYYLPTFAGAPDYTVQVAQTKLFVSTRMVRCFYAGDDASSRLNYWLIHRLGLPSLVEQRKLKQIHPVPIGTFIAKRFQVKAVSVESAIQNGFYSWVEDIVHEISKLIEAIRTTSPAENRHLLPVLAANSLPMFFLAATGANGGIGIEQFAAHARQAGLRALSDLKKDNIDAVHEYLNSNKPMPIEDQAIGLARAFLHHGYRDLALVQVCVTCESILAHRYR